MATASVGSDAGSSPTRLKSARSGGLGAALESAFHHHHPRGSSASPPPPPGALLGRRGSGTGSLLRRLSGGSDASGGTGTHEGRGSLDSWSGRLSRRASKAGA
jgi:hypothetical protein